MKIPKMRPSKEWKEGLHDLCKDLKKKGVKSIAEIGCYAGEGTCILAEYFDVVYAIDPWCGGYDDTDVCSTSDMASVEYTFHINCEFVYDEIIQKYKMTSQDAADLFKKEGRRVDAVYIDAIHTYHAVKKDIELWYPIVDIAISGHDAEFDLVRVSDSPCKQAVGMAILEWLYSHDITEVPKTYKDTSWVIWIEDLLE